MSDRPNFVLLMTDTRAADFIGCYGRPELHTPYFDALVAEGVRFDPAYMMCFPARLHGTGRSISHTQACRVGS